MKGAFRVWASIARGGRCKFCRLAIVWRTTDRGKALPFNGVIPAMHVEPPDERGRQFEVLSADDLHLRTCQKRRQTQLAQAARGQPVHHGGLR